MSFDLSFYDYECHSTFRISVEVSVEELNEKVKILRFVGQEEIDKNNIFHRPPSHRLTGCSTVDSGPLKRT